MPLPWQRGLATRLARAVGDSHLGGAVVTIDANLLIVVGIPLLDVVHAVRDALHCSGGIAVETKWQSMAGSASYF